MAWAREAFPFFLNSGASGNAVLQYRRLDDGRTLVVCHNADQDEEAPVNMRVEEIRDEFCRRTGLSPSNLLWIEYSRPYRMGDREVGGWEFVTFRHDDEPAWEPMTLDDWEQMGLDPPEV